MDHNILTSPPCDSDLSATNASEYQLLLNIPREIYYIPSVSVPANYCYCFLHVNHLLTIKIYLSHLRPLEYEYCFRKIRHIICRYIYACT